MIKGGPSIVRDGLIFCVDFADAQSYVSGAAKVFSLAGVESGSVTYGGSGGYSTSACGAFNCAATGYIMFGTGSPFAFSSPSFSAGVWCYFDGTNQMSIALSKREDGPNYQQYSIGIAHDIRGGGSGTRFGFFTGTEDAIYSYGDYDLAPTGAGWYYGIFTVAATSQIFYINSIPRITNSVNVTGKTYLITNRGFMIGGENLGGAPGVFFKSLIGHVHMYNRPLTSEEVYHNYNTMKGRFGRVT